jgi:putative endonuclease
MKSEMLLSLHTSLAVLHSYCMPLVRPVLRLLDVLTSWFPSACKEAEHFKTGRRGEEAAYFYLRRCGYTIVARNWRAPGRRGELDLVGWDGETLCFIEVKTRSERSIVPAELAVDSGKRKELIGMSHLFRKRVPKGTPCRFDVVSVYLSDPIEIELHREAFESGRAGKT